ncbi:MAG TPA: hypothetical protein VG982_02725 [Candidatus Paceibacterota bacterium]|nr:hypothetical protein [Candidatus Paceibacterota bacterium]
MSSKRNWAKLFVACPFKKHIVSSLEQVHRLSFAKLHFFPFVFRSQQDKRVRYNFIPSARNKTGVFVLRERDSNMILSTGASSKDLYEQIILHMRRYRVDHEKALLSIIQTPPSLIDAVVAQVRLSYSKTTLNDTYYRVLSFFEKGLPVPETEIPFFNLRDEIPRSIRCKVQPRSNLVPFRLRRGIYFISESKKSRNIWKTVYIGKAKDLRARPYAHFVKSQLENHGNANYFRKLKTHDYRIGIIEFPIEVVRDQALYENCVVEFEKKLTLQFNPRDNRHNKGSHMIGTEEGKAQWTSIVDPKGDDPF